MSDDRKPNQPLDDETAKILRDVAEQIKPEMSFVSGLERRLAASHPGPEVPSMFTVKRIAPVLLWVLAAIAMVLAIDWAVRSIAPQPVPAAHGTGVATSQAPVPPVDEATPVPPVKSTTSYPWRGTTLTLAAELPGGPAEAGIYAAQPQQHATLEEAVAMAQRFGINGPVYKTRGEVPGTSDFLITDGKQSLGVRSGGYFTYTADIIQSYNNFSAVRSPQAEQTIGAFLESHGFTFPRRVEWSQWRGAYLVEPLTPENTPLRYEHYAQPVLLINLGQDEQILSARAGLVDAAAEPLGHFGLLSAQDAFQKLLDPNTTSGMIESMNSVPAPMQQWTRVYPTDQTITIYGSAMSIPAVDAGQPPFIQIDGFPATGQVAGLEQYGDPRYVQATGRFVTENGITRFAMDSWKLAGANEEGLLGTLERQNGEVILTTQEAARYTLPDVPADLSVPFENAYVIGTAEGDLFQWKTIDNRMALQGGGGGGGGGGSGFYKLNLTGTPVAFPTATMAPSGTDGGTAGGAQYVVQSGDTLAGIASAFGTTVEALKQANGITDPGMLMVGQKLVIPGTSTVKIVGLRGILDITINKHEDGSQNVAYGFLASAASNPGGYMLLEGNGLEELQRYNGRPVDIWGTFEGQPGGTISMAKVDRFEIPFPDLQVQILKGTQKLTQIAGQPATMFLAEDGTTYVELTTDGTTASSLIGNEGDHVQVEAVAIPGETIDGKPALHVFGGALEIDPKTGLHINMPPSWDQPHVVEILPIGKPPDAPTATIEKVELIHFMSDPRLAAASPAPASLYFQPVWCFSGHYSNGDEFEILIQALNQQYLLPELETPLQPG